MLTKKKDPIKVNLGEYETTESEVIGQLNRDLTEVNSPTHYPGNCFITNSLLA